MAAAAMKVELSIDGRDPALFRVVRFDGEQALSEVHALTVEANVEEAVDPEDLLDRTASLDIHLWGTTRSFQGVVSAAELEMVRESAFRVRVVIAPRLLLCELGQTSRVYQEQTVKEVVSAVLTNRAVEPFRWRLSETHPKRPFVLQHQESDLDFVRRLHAEEGIGFAFTHSEDGEELVLKDDWTRLDPIEGETTLYDRAALQGAAEAAWAVSEKRALVCDAVVVKDHDMRRPGVELIAKSEAQGAAGREVYLHPGGFLDEPEGKRRARIRLEALGVAGRSFSGRSSCLRLEPGRTFTLQGCPNASANVDHLVIAVRHRGFVQDPEDGTTWAYQNEFRSIPAGVPWRPPFDVGAAPRGPQLAVVTVPAGQEIHCDDYGRIKVRFLWDRTGPGDDRSSHWVRVGQLALGGSLVLPRGGFEVLVDFEQGDLDRPFVAGHLYNGESKPPYDLPAGKTRSSFQSATTSGGSGANELRFEDSAGGEEIFFNASKDLSITAHDAASEAVGNDRKVSVGASRKLVVGQDHFANVKGDRTLDVAANLDLQVEAKLSDGIGGSEKISVGGMRKVEVGGDLVGTVKGSWKREVAALQATTAILGLERKTVGSSEVTVGAAWAEMVAGTRKSSCGGTRKETTGAVKVIKAKQVKVSAAKNLAVTAAGALSTKCGGNRSDSAGGALLVSAGSGISVKAESILIEAKSSLELRAGAVKIKLDSSGTVTIKAPKIDLRGVKELAQAVHRSN
ncbi:MAG: type VI secretion system Vgr family protein [Myxococcales bacterium]